MMGVEIKKKSSFPFFDHCSKRKRTLKRYFLFLSFPFPRTLHSDGNDGFLNFYRNICSIILLLFVSSCGFKSEPELAASRLQYSKNKCPELYITDNYSTSTNNSITAKQVFKIEAQSPDAANYKPENAYPVYHSFINNANLVGNIMVNKNIRNKACQDYYLTNIKYFEK